MKRRIRERKDHVHIMRKAALGKNRKWFCTILGCSHQTKNPIDLVGQVFQCSICARFFRFEKEDASQKEGLVRCPICAESAIPERVIETESINIEFQKHAVQLLNQEASSEQLKTRQTLRLGDGAVSESLKEIEDMIMKSLENN